MFNNKFPDLEYPGDEWLRSKINRMKNLLEIAEPDEAIYREIMLSLGYPDNKINFLELALLLPYREIKLLKERKKIENALLYRAGFIDISIELHKDFDYSLRMSKNVWELKNIRPANFPDKRIYGISFLLSETINAGLVNYFIQKIENEIVNNKNIKNSVKNIMDFKGLGEQRKIEMFFNIIMPFIIAYTGDKNKEIIEFLYIIFEKHPPLFENSIIKNFKKIFKDYDINNLNRTTKTYFGIHYYLKNVVKL